jgi:tetratricopeptide (TPR) repeat protein
LFYLRGFANSGSGHYGEAIIDFTHALEAGADKKKVLSARAQAYYQRGYYTEALEDYRALIDNEPDSAMKADAYYNRGNTKKDLEDYQGALADYNRALELNPGYVSAYNNRASARSIKADYAGAMEDYLQAYKRQPKNYEYLKRMADIKEKLDDPIGAEACREEYNRLRSAAK